MTTVLQARTPRVDPHDCTDSADALAILRAVHAALVRRTGPGAFAPDLAQGWTVSPDARAWSFRLRDGLRFHDGRQLDAEAAAASLRRMARPDVGATLGAPAVWAQYLGDATIAAHDARTVTVTTPEPTADLLDVLCCGVVLPPDEAADLGAGPFAVAERTADAVTLRGADGRTLRFVAEPDPAARLAALAEGRAQLATGLAPDAAAPGVSVLRHTDPTLIVYLFNCARPAVADPRVRRALNLALDRPALARAVLNGAAEPLEGALSPAHLGHAPLTAVHDPAEARRLLREAGAADLTLTVDIPTSLPDEAEALTAAVAAQLVAVGVGVETRVWPDRTAYAERVRAKGIGDLCLFDSSPVSIFRTLREKIDSRVKGAWWQGYANAEVEALLDRARAETDVAARGALYRQARDVMRADPPWLTVWRRVHAAGAAGRAPAIGDDGVLDARALA